MMTRRDLIKAGSAVGVGTLASSLTYADDPESNRVARICFDSYGTLAFRQALLFAGNDGYVASLPQLLHARVNADYDNIIWNTWFSANSEESVVATPQGNHVVVTVHGGGILGKPSRMERALRADLSRHNDHGLTGQYAAKITASEVDNLLEGRLPDGTEFPIYDFAAFRQGIADLPMRYGVVIDLETAKKSATGYVEFDALREDPIMICRAGGPEAAAAYLDKARKRNDTSKMRFRHRHDAINPDEPQTRLVSMGGNEGGKGSAGYEGLSWGYGEDWGLSSSGPVDMGRYVAVSPRDRSSSLHDLDFES